MSTQTLDALDKVRLAIVQLVSECKPIVQEGERIVHRNEDYRYGYTSACLDIVGILGDVADDI